MGKSVRAGESSEHSDAASEREFREREHDEHADDQCAGKLSSAGGQYWGCVVVVEHGGARGVDYGRNDRERGCGSDEPDCGIELGQQSLFVRRADHAKRASMEDHAVSDSYDGRADGNGGKLKQDENGFG